MPEQSYDKDKVAKLLNQILEEELAGVVRYTHYSFMVYGYSRIPIVSWFREQANESMTHAQQAGELLTALGEHPSLGIGQLLETHKHDIGDILREALDAEKRGLGLYRELLELVEDRNITLEEYARTMISEEQMHLWEVDKMLRKPGDIDSFVQQQKID
ncbi:MAG: bacterioferritin [Acidobacteria bacterium]|nr:bacterioferritin [Acidobacteriota bacterium]